MESASSYPKIATLKYSVLGTILGLSIYYLLGYGFSPEQFTFEQKDILEILTLIILDQFLIELLYFYLLFLTIESGIRIFDIKIYRETGFGFSHQFFWIVPVFLCSFFFLNPVTQSLRYLLRFGFELNPEVYLNQYLFSSSLYVVYTTIGSLIGLSVLIAEMIKRNKSDGNSTKSMERLIGEHEAMMKPVDLKEVYWIEVRGRKYFIITGSKELKTNKKLSELEGLLPKDGFIRINRSTIINVQFVNSYTSWNSGTYLIEMKPPRKKDFIVSRGRVKQFLKIVGQ